MTWPNTASRRRSNASIHRDRGVNGQLVGVERIFPPATGQRFAVCPGLLLEGSCCGAEDAGGAGAGVTAGVTALVLRGFVPYCAPRMRRRRLVLGLSAVAGLAFVGCGPPETPASRVLRPLEVRRARAIIEHELQRAGSPARPGRSFELEHGYRLREDAQIGAGPYGIAYVSREEAALAGPALPKRDAEATKLRLLRPTSDAIVLLLFQDSYRYDAGDEVTAPVIAAEKMLARDVADFLVHVVKMGASR